MKTMASNNGTILQFVYYYPPINGTLQYPASLIGLSYYNIAYAQPSPFGIPEVAIIGGFSGQNNYADTLAYNYGKEYTIFMTPQAYVSWYNDSGIEGLIVANPKYSATNTYLNTLFNYCNETPSYPLSTIENNTIVFPNEINEWYYTIQELNIKFIPYSSSYTEDNYTLSSVALDPVKTYGFTSNELYMMVIPSSTLSSSTTSTSVTNPTNYYNNASGIEAEEITFINTQASNYATQVSNTTPASQVSTDVNNITTTIKKDIENIPNTISSALTGTNGWIYWLGIGVVAVVGVLAITIALKK